MLIVHDWMLQRGLLGAGAAVTQASTLVTQESNAHEYNTAPQRVNFLSCMPTSYQLMNDCLQGQLYRSLCKLQVLSPCLEFCPDVSNLHHHILLPLHQGA